MAVYIQGVPIQVQNIDGSITVTNISGSIQTISLNINHPNIFNLPQTFINYGLQMFGSSTGYTIFGSLNTSAVNFSINFPALSGVIGVAGAPSVNFPGGTPAGTSSNSFVMMGLGSILVFTPLKYGIVEFSISGDEYITAGQNGTLQFAYGTGTAPANGHAATGTVFTPIFVTLGFVGIGPIFFTRTVIITGLTPGVTYWFDAQLMCDGGSTGIERINACIKELQY